MKVGLLLCDHVRSEYQSAFGDYPPMFAAAWPAFDFEVFAVCDGEFPASVKDCSAYLASGSRFSVYEEHDWILELKSLVKEIAAKELPYLGVCFGHQMLAEALDGKVKKADSGWCVGIHRFEMQEQASWMNPYQASLNLLMMCQDQVQVLPPDSKVLASAPTCPVGMFQVGERMLGVQAHPEFSRPYDRVLMEDRVEKMGAAVVKAGVESLALPLDAGLFCQWSTQFLSR